MLASLGEELQVTSSWACRSHRAFQRWLVSPWGVWELSVLSGCTQLKGKNPKTGLSDLPALSSPPEHFTLWGCSLSN